MRARLDRAWRAWLNWTVFAVGSALLVIGSVAEQHAVVWAGYGLWLLDLVINLGYGVALVRMLWLRRKARRRARHDAKETS